MLETFVNLVELLFIGSPKAIITLLLIIILLLLLERNRMIKIKEEQEKKIEKIIEEYHKSNLHVSEIIINIKNILKEIKDKIN